MQICQVGFALIHVERTTKLTGDICDCSNTSKMFRKMFSLRGKSNQEKSDNAGVMKISIASTPGFIIK